MNFILIQIFAATISHAGTAAFGYIDDSSEAQLSQAKNSRAPASADSAQPSPQAASRETPKPEGDPLNDWRSYEDENFEANLVDPTKNRDTQLQERQTLAARKKMQNAISTDRLPESTEIVVKKSKRKRHKVNAWSND